MDMQRVVKAYIRLRDKRSEIKKAYEEEDAKYKAAQERLENEMLRFLETNKMDSVRTESGTFFRQEQVVPSASDWSALYDFIREHNAFEFLERRVTKKAVKEYMEDHDGALPPGVQVFRKYDVSVRRS